MHLLHVVLVPQQIVHHQDELLQVHLTIVVHIHLSHDIIKLVIINLSRQLLYIKPYVHLQAVQGRKIREEFLPQMTSSKVVHVECWMDMRPS